VVLLLGEMENALKIFSGISVVSNCAGKFSVSCSYVTGHIPNIFSLSCLDAHGDYF
jgi:hypothetical protein